jgi:hypothetical protein
MPQQLRIGRQRLRFVVLVVRECAVTPLSPRHSQHGFVNPQGGVALTPGENDARVIAVGEQQRQFPFHAPRRRRALRARVC